jgi:hypothetical protein
MDEIVDSEELRAALGRPANLAAGTTGRRVLDIPTPDDNPSTTHPDVVFVPEGWNGYRYWMVHTPFPAEARENPCIVASQNGVDWVEPDGISNPVAPLADAVADGHTFQSDACLVLLADDTMRLYYRASSGGGGTTFYYRESTDGATWSARTSLGAHTNRSPSVHRLDDDTFVMYAVNASNQVVRHTSTDGLDWGGFASPTVCTVPTLEQTQVPWHVDMHEVDGRWYMLLASCATPAPSSPYRLYYFTSTDGTTFTGAAIHLPLTDMNAGGQDENGHYRSAFVPVPGSPLKWDIWVSGVGSGDGISNPWRISLRRGVDLAEREYVRKWDDAIWLPAYNFRPTGTGVATGLISTAYPTMSVPDSALAGLAQTFSVPQAWQTYTDARCRVVLYWTQDATDTPAGDVTWDLYWRAAAEDGVLSTVGATTTAVTVPGPARLTLVRTVLLNSMSMPFGRVATLYVRRRGADVSDTFVGAVHVLGISVEGRLPDSVT